MRLLGRSKLKLTILLFLITISLLLGRLTISGLASYQDYIGRQKHNNRLPSIKLFDIPYEAIRQNQPRDYDIETFSRVRPNATNADIVKSLDIVTKQIANKNIKTKKTTSNGSVIANNTVTLVVSRKGVKEQRPISVNSTFQFRNKSKSSQEKMNVLAATPANNNGVQYVHVDVVDNVNISLGFRFNVSSGHVTQTKTDMLKTTPSMIENKKSSSPSGSQNGVDKLDDEITTTVPSSSTTPELLNPHSFQFIMDANDLCSRKEPPFLLILVMSIHDHMDVRNAIRQTWGAVAKGGSWPGRTVEETVKLAFLLGLHQFPERESLLVAENEKYGDIIQENFVDSYYNLSIKMVMGLKWASQYCPGVSFILKADEDTFVNLPLLVDILRQPETPRDTIIGRIMPESKVYRVGKWSVDKKAYAGKVYPPYAAGNTYVIPGSLARKLYKASERHLYIHVEDAFITGLLAQAIGASHLDMPGFTCQADSPPQTCDFVLDLKISGTKANMGLMRHIWSQIKKLPTCDE